MRKSIARNRDRLERRALLATRSLVDRMRALYRGLERLTGAPIAVHRALACVAEEPGIAASRLALALGMQRPAVSHVLRGLVERGWIERVRSDSDQRSVRVYLTAAGQSLVGATAGRAIGALQRSVRKLSSEKLQGLATGVEEILLHLPAPTSVAIVRAPARTRRGRIRPTSTSVAVRGGHSRASHGDGATGKVHR
ncbi:MAG TPA: MarR family transcriptional regulator [Steroidobacteraceae bacterium]|nr:MarR family transcriptional regulator [Steroidobacteraceae bacterium]